MQHRRHGRAQRNAVDLRFGKSGAAPQEAVQDHGQFIRGPVRDRGYPPVVDDPVTLEHPYSYTRYYEWRPDVRPSEYICEENNRNAPVNGVTVAK